MAPSFIRSVTELPLFSSKCTSPERPLLLTSPRHIPVVLDMESPPPNPGIGLHNVGPIKLKRPRSISVSLYRQVPGNKRVLLVVKFASCTKSVTKGPVSPSPRFWDLSLYHFQQKTTQFETIWAHYLQKFQNTPNFANSADSVRNRPLITNFHANIPQKAGTYTRYVNWYIVSNPPPPTPPHHRRRSWGGAGDISPPIF